MIQLKDLREFVWPWLERLSPEELEEREKRPRSDRARIDALNLTRAPDVALDEARRVADSEGERRRGADQKAATYLPLVAALIPVILTLVSSLWDKKAGSAPAWFNMPVLGLAVAYTAAAGVWSFRVLKVTISHELGLGDFEIAWRKREPVRALARRILLYARLNQDPVNWKVSCLKMAHEFLLRAFITFSALLLFNIVWFLSTLGWSALAASSPQAAIDSPRNAIAASATVGRLVDRLKIAEAWLVLSEECRARSGGNDNFEINATPPMPTTALPAPLKRLPNELGAMRFLKITCAGRSVAQSQAWYLPVAFHKLGNLKGLPEPLNSSATPTVVAVNQDWPPPDLNAVSVTLPGTLARQTVLLRTHDQEPVAIVQTKVGAEFLPLR